MPRPATKQPVKVSKQIDDYDNDFDDDFEDEVEDEQDLINEEVKKSLNQTSVELGKIAELFNPKGKARQKKIQKSKLECDFTTNACVKDNQLVSFVSIKGFADYFIDLHELHRFEGDRVVWGNFPQGELDISKPIHDLEQYIIKTMIKEFGDIKNTLFQQATLYIKALIPDVKDTSGEFDVRFMNKMINVQTKQSAGTNQFTPNLIPHWYYDREEWEPRHHEAHKQLLDMMAPWTNGDRNKELEIFEMIGLSMTRHMKHDRVYLVGGDAQNGKSILAKLITNILGEDNVMNNDLHTLATDEFAPSTLLGKLANISRDTSGDYINDISKLKKLSSGDEVSTSLKGKDRFSLKSSATLINFANSLPMVKEKGDSDAWFRRVFIISMNNKILPSNEGYAKIKKISNDPDVLEVAVTLSVEAIHRMVKIQGPNEPKQTWTRASDSIALSKEYIEESNPINAFIRANFYGRLNEVYDLDKLFMDYSNKVEGEYKMKKSNFIKTLKAGLRKLLEIDSIKVSNIDESNNWLIIMGKI